jgi:hypothetical protein
VNTLPAFYTQGVAAITTFATDGKTNITNIIPVVKANIVTEVGVQQTFLEAAFSCKPIATKVYQVRQGLCGQMVSSFDAFWSSLCIMAIWSLFSLPITVFVANTLFLDLTKYQRQDMEYQNVSSQRQDMEYQNVSVN